MAEKTDKEVEQKVETDEQAEEQAMAAAFNDEPPPARATAQPDETDESKEPEGKETENPPDEPEYVQLTKKDYDALMATTNMVASLDKGLKSLSGNMGGLQQALQRMQQETPAGEPVVVSDEDVAEFAEDFPELGGRLKTTLQRIADRLNVKGTATASPAFDEEAAGKFVTKREEARELKLLGDLVPDWQEIVGHHSDAENPYRQWLATKDEAYQNLINNTSSAIVTWRSIELYRQETAPKSRAQTPNTTPDPRTPKDTSEADARRRRIKDAVTPKGTGQAPQPQTQSEQEAFESSFNST